MIREQCFEKRRGGTIVPAAEIVGQTGKGGADDGCAAESEDMLLVAGKTESCAARAERVAGKGKGSFLRRVEGFGEYNTGGTWSHCLCYGTLE